MNATGTSRRRAVKTLFCTSAVAMLKPVYVRAAEPSVIRIAYNLPKEHPIGQFFETLAAEIDKNTALTSLRIKAKTFPNGQLFNDAQLPDAISTGSVEIGQVNIGFINAPAASVGQIVNLPVLWNSWEALWYAEDNKAYRNIFRDLFNQLGMHLLGFAAYGTGEFYATKPVKMPNDFKGLRLRAYGKESSDLIRLLGASPVTLSSQEMYQGTQRGIIDGFLTGPSSVYSRKLYEVVKYSSAASILRASFEATCNMSWWRNLPKDTQAAIDQSATVAEKKGRDLVSAEDKYATEQIAKLGVLIQTLTSQERAQWIQTVKPMYDKYLQNADEKGKRLMQIVNEANSANPR